MTLREIQINFNNANNRANRLDEIAGEMRRLANGTLLDSLARLSNSWQGESADLYQRKGKDLADQILREANDLGQIAAAIRKTAQNTMEAERRAYEIAQRRSYAGGGSDTGRY